MPKTATKPAEARVAVPVDDLAQAVVYAIQPGNGRQNRCELMRELPQRLQENGVVYRPEDLQSALTRLEDSGVVVRVQRRNVVHLALAGMKTFDAQDRLTADIADLIKQHGDEFEIEAEVRSWLTEAGIEWDDRGFDLAIYELEIAGRLKRPRQDHWDEGRPLPGYWVPPRCFNE